MQLLASRPSWIQDDSAIWLAGRVPAGADLLAQVTDRAAALDPASFRVCGAVEEVGGLE